MTSAFEGIFLAYLLSVSFTDQLQMNVSSIEKLVEYSYNFPSQGLIPSVSYNGSIGVKWAVPDSALAGLEGKSLAVRVSATSENVSAVAFSTPIGVPVQLSETYLRCDVSGGRCANTSVLFAEIPLTVRAEEGVSIPNTVTLRSEISDNTAPSAMEQSASGILDSLAGFFPASGANGSGNSTSDGNASRGEGGNFLDTLKPEGDSHDTIAFLKENPIISLSALAIVIVITGAYLLNAKD